MITKESFERLAGNPVQLSARRLVEHLTTYGLTPSTDIKAIKKEYKTKLFNQLLEADAGLRLKRDMLRTEEARQKLLEETIDLDGYTELVEAEQLISRYLQDYSSLYDSASMGNPLRDHGITAEAFLNSHEYSIQSALAAHVIDLAGNENYQKLEKARDAINDLVDTGIIRGNQDLFPDLDSLLKRDERHRLCVDDSYAYHVITKKKK